MKSQPDTWSMKSYPVNNVEDNSSYGEIKTTNNQPSETSKGIQISLLILEEETANSRVPPKETSEEVSEKDDELRMAAPLKRKRKHYPNPGKASRKRRRK